MKYLVGGIDFFRRNCWRSFLILLFDACFFILFLPISNWSLSLLIHYAEQVHLGTMSTALQTMSGLPELQDNLVGIFFRILAVLFIFILLIILNFGITKYLVWLLSFGKSFQWSILLKFCLGTTLILFLFSPLLFLSILPLLAYSDANATLLANGGTFPPSVIFPFLICFILIVYFFTHFNHSLIQSGMIWNSVKQGFRQGVFSLHLLWYPFVILFVGSFVLLRLLSAYEWSLFAGLLFIIITSFFNRLYFLTLFH